MLGFFSPIRPLHYSRRINEEELKIRDTRADRGEQALRIWKKKKTEVLMLRIFRMVTRVTG